MDESKEGHNSPERNVEMVRKYSKKSRKFFGPTLRRILLYGLIIPALILALYTSYLLGQAVGKHEFTQLVHQATATISHKEATPEQSLPSADFAPFWDAWFLLEKHFAEETPADSPEPQTQGQDRVWGAIQGLTASYGDPFTSFLPPEEHEHFEADISGEFTGVGMEIGNRDGFLTVISPLPGSPADKAGIRPKDIIEHIDGEDSLRMGVGQAVNLIRGPQGEEVTLTILRRGETEPLEISITRDVITIPTIETQIVDDTFVIKLFSFTTKSPRLFAQALQEFAESGQSKLILDLRGNPGGFLEAAIDITSRFLPEEAVIVTEQYSDTRGEKIRYSTGYNHFNDNLRMVTLINNGSASASEIVAGALRDHNQALLIGQQSFGKGSVQELFNLTKDTSLKITIAKWLTPSGAHISEEGITPDITTSPYEREEDGSTYSQDYREDTEIKQAIDILARDDFQELFTTIPAELQNLNVEEGEDK